MPTAQVRNGTVKVKVKVNDKISNQQPIGC